MLGSESSKPNGSLISSATLMIMACACTDFVFRVPAQQKRSSVKSEARRREILLFIFFSPPKKKRLKPPVHLELPGQQHRACGTYLIPQRQWRHRRNCKASGQPACVLF